MIPDRAHVTAVEALESFRASLLIYASKARPALDEITAEVTRTRLWLQHEQRTYWEGQWRRRTQVLEQARQAEFGARLSPWRDSAMEEKRAVQRAQRAVEEAEAKLQRVKQWTRQFDSRIEPLARQIDTLRNALAQDLPRAAAHLAQLIQTLAAYADVAAAPALETAAPPGEGSEAAPGVESPTHPESAPSPVHPSPAPASPTDEPGNQ